MSRDNKAMQDDDTTNPGMLAVLDGEALWSAKAGARGQILRRLPRRRQGQHERRRGALSGVRRARGPPGRPRAAHQSVRASGQKAPPLRLREPRAAGADGLCRACNRAACRSRRHDDPRLKPFIETGPRGRSTGARASSISPARNATTTTGASTSPATPSRRRIRPAIRSTGWNGRARLAAAAAAQLHDRHARGDLCLRRARVCRSGALPDVARARHDGRDAGGAAMSGSSKLRGYVALARRHARRQDHAARLPRGNASGASPSSIRPSAPSSD